MARARQRPQQLAVTTLFPSFPFIYSKSLVKLSALANLDRRGLINRVMPGDKQVEREYRSQQKHVAWNFPSS